MEAAAIDVRRFEENDGGSDARAVAALLEATEGAAAYAAAFGGATAEDVARAAATSVLAVVAARADGSVAGFCALASAPPATDALEEHAGDLGGAAWPAWLARAFPRARAPAHSSLWVSGFAADPLAERDVADAVFRAVFATVGGVDQVLLLAHGPQAPHLPAFEMVPRGGGGEAAGEQRAAVDSDGEEAAREPGLEDAADVLVCRRSAYVPELFVRDARVEDHDDLVPLFERQSEVLSDTFGEFFLAELIESQTETSRAVVAEVDGRAVGFVSATSEVDTGVLERCFELDAYDGLRGRANECNAFAVTLFCIDEELESRAADFLRPVFDLFPGREYCLVTLPHTAEEPLFLSGFSYAVPRPANTFSHVLYLLSRSTIDAGQDLCVRRAAHGDMLALQDLLAGVNGAEGALDAARAAAEREPAADEAAALLVECQGQPVGLAVVEPVAPAAELSRHGAVEEVFSPEHHPAERQAELVYFALNPIFERRARFVFGEAMRLLDKTVLHYRVYRGLPLMPLVVREFVQVRPRLGGQAHQAAAGASTVDDAAEVEGAEAAAVADVARAAAAASGARERREREKALRANSVFGHYVLPCSRLADPKRVCNARVVVVGASDTGRAVLEELLLQQRLHLANVTLVSPGGLSRGTAAQRRFLPAAVGYDDDGGARLARLALDARARVVPAAVAGFSADRRVVQLDDGYLVPYDYLVLCPGLQDQAAADLQPEDAGEDERLRGLFSVAAGDALDGLAEQVEEAAAGAQGDPVVVYGASLEALTAVRGLILSGVPADRVVWVSPAARGDATWCAGDSELHERVLLSVEEHLGVACVRSMALERVQHQGGQVSGVTLRSTLGAGAPAPADFRLVQVPGEPGAYTLPCAALLSAAERDVSRPLFRAVQANSMVYDGRLVVDARFRTARANVFAAGSVAKFSRRDGGERHERMSPAALGRALVRSLVCELEGGAGEPPSPLPELRAAGRPVLAALPGEDTFFMAASGRARVPVPDKARVVAAARGDSLSRIVLDGRGNVHSVSFFGHHAVAPRNLTALVGRPWTLLGALLERHDRGEGGDLTRSLAEPWAHALFEDNFGGLLREVRRALEQDGDAEQLRQHVRLLASKGELHRETVEAAASHLPESTRVAAQRLTLRYLRRNAERLPVYARRRGGV